MKKSLSLVVAIAMVLSLLVPATAFAATSAERSAGAELEDLGILKGNGEGELYLDNELNRQDMIVLLSRLMGVEDEVEEYGNTHGWEDVSDPYYNSYISWAKEEGLTVGVGDGSEFGYNGELSVQELLTFMIRALGYEGDWYEVPELAVELGLIEEDTDLEATATRGSMAVVTLLTLNTPVEGSEKTLGAHLGLDGFEPVFNETTAEALNLIQVEVVLEDGFNENEAKKKNNYKFDDVKVEKVELDGNVALLILNKPADNKSDDVLEINSRVTGGKVELDVHFVDTTVPEVTDAAVIGKDVVKVKFSEPIDFDPTGKFANRSKAKEFSAKIGNKNYLVKRVEVIDHGAEANVYFHGTFSEGTLDFKIGNGLDDFAGFSLVTESFELDVVKDDTPPTVVDFKDASRGEITLVFDEDITIEGDHEDFYHTNKKNHVGSGDYEVEGNELKLYFTDSENYLPDGRAYVYINAEAVANLWGIENDQIIRVEVDIEEDNEGPVVEEIDVSSSQIKITFNEQLDEDSAEDRDNYVLLDDDGKEVKKLQKPSLSSNLEVVTISFKGSIDEGTYTLEIKGVEDLSGNRMSKHSEDITIDDNTPPTVPTEAYLATDGHDRTITLDFGEEMEVDGKYSVIDLDNYSIGGYLLSELEDEFDVRVDIDAYDSNELVEIIIQDVNELDFAVVDGTTLTVYRVADVDGNITAASSPVTLVDDYTRYLEIDTVEAISKDEIKVKFKQNLDSIDENDFFIHFTTDTYSDGDTPNAGYATQSVSIATVDHSASKEVIIELSNELNTDATYQVNGVGATYSVYLIIDGNNTENRYGLSIQPNKVYQIEDKIDVEVDDEDVTAVVDKTTSNITSTITIEFSEDVENTINRGTFEVQGGDVDVISATMTDAVGGYGRTVEIVVDGEVYVGDDVTLKGNLFDRNNNLVDDLELEIDDRTVIQ